MDVISTDTNKELSEGLFAAGELKVMVILFARIQPQLKNNSSSTVSFFIPGRLNNNIAYFMVIFEAVCLCNKKFVPLIVLRSEPPKF